MNFLFSVNSPPLVFNSEYYRRRWTIRFCILGLLMLLLVSSALVSLNLTTKTNRSNSETLLLSLAPFFLHSLQLTFAVGMLLSQRKDVKMIRLISTWQWTSKIILPSSFLEVTILRSWNFNWVMVLLTIFPYVIAVIKVNQIINQLIPPIHKLLNRTEAITVVTCGSHVHGYHVSGLIRHEPFYPLNILDEEELELPCDSNPPTYFEALQISKSKKTNHSDMPPKYFDLFENTELLIK